MPTFFINMECEMKVNLPILKAMEEYNNRNMYPLHTPGHKGGRVVHSEFLNVCDEKALRLDVSLMGEELGNLHSPSGCIAESEQLAAKLYGVNTTHFAVNGSSGAIQAMLMGALQPGDKVLVARNMHCSTIAALLLARLEPVFLNNEYISEFAIHGQVGVEQIELALAKTPDIKGIFITSPTYYGLLADVEGIVSVAKHYQIPVLVDEAHGAHLYFTDMLPQGALRYGVTAVVQSTHKTLSSLSQTAMLHVKDGGKIASSIKRMQNMLTTTSPNYFLLASLDAARGLMQESGAELWCRAYEMALEFREKINNIEGLRVLEISDIKQYGSVFALDITKVTVNVRERGYKGTEVASYLADRGYSAELADRDNVLFLLTYAEDVSRLEELVQILRALPPREAIACKILPEYRLPKCEMSIAQAYYADAEMVLINDAVGRISAETVTFYPPGIPCLLPGEVLSEQGLQYFQQMIKLGITVNGCKDRSLQFINVVKE